MPSKNTFYTTIIDVKIPVCRIVGAGDFFAEDFYVNQNDLIIAADGGYVHLKKAGVKPHLIIGDFDSLSLPPEDDIKILTFPVEKDDTDMLLAVKEGISRGYELFALYGGLGGERISHTMANISILASLCADNKQGFLINKKTEITAVRQGFVEYGESAEGNISVFAYGGEAIISIKGLKYECTKQKLSPEFSLGVSNSFVGKRAFISVESGCIVLVRD